MKVFISWSGSRSQDTAKTLGDWLRKVIQAVEPWSSTGIEKGLRWQHEVAAELEQAGFGIVCLNRENCNEPWLLFEAGALSKLGGAHVCTFLLDLPATEVEQPLAQFQATTFEKEDVRKLVHTIRGVVERSERTISESELEALFDSWYPALEGDLAKIASRPYEGPSETRTERALIEEILELVRGSERERKSDRVGGTMQRVLQDIFAPTDSTTPWALRTGQSRHDLSAASLAALSALTPEESDEFAQRLAVVKRIRFGPDETRSEPEDTEDTEEREGE